MSSRPSRRRVDIAVAALIAVVFVAVGLVIYVKSDARATTLTTVPTAAPPATMTAAPTSLDQVWQLTTSPAFPAVVSPYGTVVTADDHTVTAHNAVTGLTEWSYSRSNVVLCALGSGDTKASDNLSSSGAVRGIVTGYAKSGKCSEITTLNPITGVRMYQRTGFTAQDSTLVFGGPYAGLVSDDLAELWRYDLVHTIQYGNQPEPTKPNTKHLGCTFTDIAVTSNQFGTIEHCPESEAGSNAQLVLNYDDPGATTDGKSKSWDALNFDPRTTVDLKSENARLLSVTSEQAAVLVSSPTPAVVVYDAKGAEISRTPVDVSADQIVAADANRVTPVVIGTDARYLLVGHTLLAVGSTDLNLRWTMPDVLGTPGVVGDELLVPTTAGIAVVADSTGLTTSTLPIDRAGYQGRVDIHVVGNTVVEARGPDVIGFRDPSAPATDPPLVKATATVASTPDFRLTQTGPATNTGDSGSGSSSGSTAGG